MGRINTSPRYVMDITGQDPLSLGDLGEGGISIVLARLVLLGLLGR